MQWNLLFLLDGTLPRIFFIHMLVTDKGSLSIVTLNFCNKKKKLIFEMTL